MGRAYLCHGSSVPRGLYIYITSRFERLFPLSLLFVSPLSPLASSPLSPLTFFFPLAHLSLLLLLSPETLPSEMSHDPPQDPAPNLNMEDQDPPAPDDQDKAIHLPEEFFYEDLIIQDARMVMLLA